jgi:hypothetical protein
MSWMSVDSMYGEENIEISIEELAESLKTPQKRRISEVASDGVAEAAQSSETWKKKVEEYRRKGWLNPPEPQPMGYHAEDKWAFLKRLPKVTVSPNPYAINELIERGKNRGIVDLYSEREQRTKTKPLDEVYETEGLLPATVGRLDLYAERVKSRRRATSTEQTALALIRKYGLR